MTEDGTIVLRLHAQAASGMRGETVLRYRRDHPDYDRIRQHVGPLEPGQTVLVRPWPDQEPCLTPHVRVCAPAPWADATQKRWSAGSEGR